VERKQSKEAGQKSAESLRRETRREERRTEIAKGSELAKGADRVEERARASDGKSAGQKQH